MRQGAVRPRADDRLERRLLRSLLVIDARDVPGDVALAAADKRNLLDQPLEHPVGDRTRPAERLELALVLDRAQLLDETLPRHELDAAPTQLLRERPREDVRLEADAP